MNFQGPYFELRSLRARTEAEQSIEHVPNWEAILRPSRVARRLRRRNIVTRGSCPILNTVSN